MKTYDHEPTIAELFDQLEEEYATIPDFLPAFLRWPVIRKLVGPIVKKAMIDNVIHGMLT